MRDIPDKLFWQEAQPAGKRLADMMEALENLYRGRLDERGRIYVPKVIREKLQIRLGERIYIRIENDHFAAYTRNTIRKRLMQV